MSTRLVFTRVVSGHAGVSRTFYGWQRNWRACVLSHLVSLGHVRARMFAGRLAATVGGSV